MRARSRASRRKRGAARICVSACKTVRFTLVDNYAGPDRARLIGELQHLDAVTQMLSALSGFAASAGAQARAGAPVDFAAAVANIGLSDMAYRLRLACFEHLEDDWRLEDDAGEVDMF